MESIMTSISKLGALSALAILLGATSGAFAASTHGTYLQTAGLNCNDAADLIMRRGLSNPQAVDCNGTDFQFNAKEGGRWTSVYVNSSTGSVIVPDASSIENDFRSHSESR
jgi:hypothetical protein